MQLSNIIKQPWISEKATDLTTIGKYVFLVEDAAHRRQIKEIIEKMYAVHITKMNTVRVVYGNTRYKKAVVTLKEGEKIDIIPH
ncbi:MAG: 50S ribosomal protein L23 [bacterium]